MGPHPTQQLKKKKENKQQILTRMGKERKNPYILGGNVNSYSHYGNQNGGSSTPIQHSTVIPSQSN
jgi:hypothetical protein